MYHDAFMSQMDQVKDLSNSELAKFQLSKKMNFGPKQMNLGIFDGVPNRM